MTELSALIVDDDVDFRESLALLVARAGFETHQAGSLASARERLTEEACDVVLLDLSLPDGEGMELLDDEEFSERTEFVVVTGNAALDTAIVALRRGALDYLTKPIDRSRLDTILTNVERTRGLKREVSTLREELRDLGRFGEMVGRSEAMQRIYDLLGRVAPSDSTVFVTGESGTGKELVAETVHRLSKRKKEPFIAVNCGAMSSTLIESELFGHEKGAFTGADRKRVGYFEEASGGTLFLDEITEMPIELQVKLLRVLETGTITRVGTTQATEVDVRIVAASNRDPQQAIADGELREDLYYRLNVFPVELPPLRERGDDIALIASVFLESINQREGTARRFSESALAQLACHDWPGNVRELKNAVERAAILSDDVIEPDVLPFGASSQAGGAPAAAAGSAADADAGATLRVRVGSSIEEVERRLILATLEQLEGDKKRAAQLLGISLKTLYNRLNVYEAQGTQGAA